MIESYDHCVVLLSKTHTHTQRLGKLEQSMGSGEGGYETKSWEQVWWQ